MIKKLPGNYDVAPLVEQLEAHPEIWNQYRQRTEMYGTPHNGVSDIWVRYRPWEQYTGDWAAFHDEHLSEWYSTVAKIPAAWSISRRVFRNVGGRRLGGVLITKIPPGGRVEPHTDGGWHATYYEKFAVQIKGNKDQAFCFEGSELRAEPGELYTFDNSKLHWVRNDSNSDRVTMIVCVKR